ncbi:MAG: dockerin type I domain-containing protein [Porcipelethomonas sp.]
MKIVKKALIILLSISTFALSAPTVFAEDAAKEYDFSFSDKNNTFNCNLNDEYIEFDLSEFCNGIVFRAEDDVDVSALDLKYDFVCSNYPTWGSAGLNSMILGHNARNSDSIYSCHVDGDVSELTEYAKELSEMDEIKYAEVFVIDVSSKGNIMHTQKDDCRILIIGSDNPDEYMNKLNDDEELTAYLSEIDADTEITMMNKDSEYDDQFLCISGIKDRTEYFNIVEKLRSFENIGDNLVIVTETLLSSGVSIDFIGRDYAGDANSDKYIDVRDCAEIASKLAGDKAAELPDTSDYNKDGNVNVRDAAAIAVGLASGKI